MTRYDIGYRLQALSDITSIFEFVLDKNTNYETSTAYIERIYACCEKICDAPFAHIDRQDLGPGIRMAVFERKAVILYRVENETVWITNIFSGGKNYGHLKRNDTSE